MGPKYNAWTTRNSPGRRMLVARLDVAKFSNSAIQSILGRKGNTVEAWDQGEPDDPERDDAIQHLPAVEPGQRGGEL